MAMLTLNSNSIGVRLESDHIVAYPICAACERRRQEFGDFSHDVTANVVVV